MSASEKPARKKGTSFVERVARYVDIKEKIAALTAEQDDIKIHLKDEARHKGVLDAKGNAVLCEGGWKVTCQKRMSAKIDADKAEPYLRSKGLWAKVTNTITVIDENKVEDQFQRGALTQAEVMKFTVVKESEALLVDRA